MRTIYKYPLPIGPGEFKVAIPVKATILCMQLQRNLPVIWALTSPDEDGAPVERVFHVFGTGQAIQNKPKLRYIGTYQMAMDTLAWHVFQEVT